MFTTTTRRWLGAASVAAAAALAPQTAHAGDDFKVYNSRALFEQELGASHVVTPSESGVTFGTGTFANGTVSGPTTYAPGALGNLFGSTESVGYTFTPGRVIPGLGYMTMGLPNGTAAFGFDYMFTPALAGETAYVQGTFCDIGNVILGIPCEQATSDYALGAGSGFFGVIRPGGLGYIDVDQVKLKGSAQSLQVANLTFAGDVTVTPEPATVALLGTGIAALAGFGAARRRKQSLES